MRRYGHIKRGVGRATSLSLGVLLACVAAGCGSGPEKSKRHFEQAQHWAAEGKVNEAVLEYRRAVQLNPKDPMAHLALAKIFIDRGDYADATIQLNSVGKNAPDNREGQDLQADLTLKKGDPVSARDLAKALIAKDPDDKVALMVLAESSILLQDEKNSSSDDNLKIAESNTDHVLEIDPTNSRAWYTKAALQMKHDQKADAEISLRKTIEYDPSSVPAVTDLVRLLLQRGDTAEAEKVVRQALDRNPQSIPVRYVLASFLMASNRSPEAEEIFRQIKAMGGNDPTNRGAVARYYRMTGNLQASAKEYEEILKQHPDDPQNSLQLAEVYVGLDNTKGADELVSSVLKKSPNDLKALVFRGRLKVEEGQIDDGIIDLTRATQLAPGWAQPQYFIGKAYVQEGKMDLAEAAFTRAAQIDPTYIDPQLESAQLLLGQDKPDAALATIEKAIEQRPQIVEPYLVRTQALIDLQRFDEAEKDTLPLVDQFRQPASRAKTYGFLAKVKFYEKRFDEAHSFAKQSLAIEPSTGSLTLLGASQIASKKSDVGLAEVAAYVHANPKWAAGYETLGQLQVSAGAATDRKDDAEKLFDNAENSFKAAVDLDPNLISAQLHWIDLEVSREKYDQAMTLLSKLAQAQPKLVDTQVLMGQVAERKKNWSGAENYYSKALQMDPSNLTAKNNLAWVYAEHGGDINSALKLAQEAKEALPDSCSLSDTLAWILVKKQNYTAAQRLLDECVKRYPDNAEFNWHLATAYYGIGDKKRGDEHRHRALKQDVHIADTADANGLLEAARNKS